MKWSILYCSVRERPAQERRRNAAPRVYVWPQNETIMENFVERRDRPVQEWKPLVEKVLKERYRMNDVWGKVSWSQKAGCSCGCSPGFIVKGALPWPLCVSDIHIQVEPLED